MSAIPLNMNAGRLLFGLSRIGYTPASAICDIVDNCVSASAENVTILIKKINPKWTDVRKNNVSEYLIIDDGIGMAHDAMVGALALGASDEHYYDGTLSKFGLGLKAAAFSQGEELHLISSTGGEFTKFVVSLPQIQAANEYHATREPLTEEDAELIAKYIPNGRGTIIRVAQVRMVNHPNVRETRAELMQKVGVIYFYYLSDGLKIRLGTLDGDDLTDIPPFDPLCQAEADLESNLNEHEWDGQSVRWIERLKTLPLDAGEGITATVEVTQLPYPPIFELNSLGGQSATRERYRIQAGNYGYYIYRNKRLIDWATGLDGVIPQDQDFYSFRGRINIDSGADESFNIDVKKASLKLSAEAQKVLEEISLEYKRKSKKAWENAKQTYQDRRGDGQAEVLANEITALVEPLDDLPGAPLPSDAEMDGQEERDLKLEAEMRARLRKSARDQLALEKGAEITDQQVTDEDVEKTLKGDTDHPHVQQIFHVPFLEDNVLWEPYFDTDLGACVRINRGHRFLRLVEEDNETNTDLRVLVDVLFHQIAAAEVLLRRKRFDEKDTIKGVEDFRRLVSEQLAHLCREAEGKLPPIRRDQKL